MDDQFLIKEQLINDLGIPLDEYHQSQKINEFTWISGYGKRITEITPNTHIGRRINELQVNHFGSVRDYDIDTLPLSYVKCKGTEITWISTRAKEFDGKYVISRRFLSKILNKWSYIVGIRYKRPSKRYEDSGIKLWAKELYVPDIIHGELREVYLLTGNDGIKMLRDILFLMRNTKYRGSDQLKRILARRNDPQRIKDRLYYDYQTGNRIWSFPKFNPEMLKGYIAELNNGNYILSMGVPIIHDLWNYPIRCTDINELEQVDDVMDDYDISGYIWERD